MRRCTMLPFVLMALAISFSSGARAAMPPNATLPDGVTPAFDLVGIKPGPPNVGIQPGPPQEFLIGFNTQPPGPPITPALDLTRPPNPNIVLPDNGLSYSIFWGMLPPPDPDLPVGSVNPGPPNFQFNLPASADGSLLPPNPNLCSAGTATGSSCFSFSATGGGHSYDILFTIAGATPLDAASWVMQPPGPPTLPAVQFNFNFLAAGDPVFSFSVRQDGQELSFAPVPEPQTWAMLLAGLGLLGFTARRRKQGA